MVITQDNRKIIEKMVKTNKRFVGNEDLFEDFCAEAVENSLFIFRKNTDIKKVENYLNKIVSNAIIHVLKSSGRITRNSEGYKNIARVSAPLENPLDNGFFDIKDTTINFVEKMVEEETLKEIYDNILKLDKENPNQKYGLIFYLKYTKNKKQKEIANVLGISQGEVSKRLFDLMQKISNEVK